MKTDPKKYIDQRKSNLKELRNLIYERSKLNSKIRFIQREMNNWDRVLLNDEE